MGLPKRKRFTFYDMVHTTGIDIPQVEDAVAAITIGKDTTFRDFAQGAYRMRGIGRGQTLRLYIIPEVLRLVQSQFGAAVTEGFRLLPSIVAWLHLNSCKSEPMQFL